MLSSFFLHAVAAGLILSTIAAPLGCVVVWQRLAYFGDTLSHASLLGIALGTVFSFSPFLGIVAVGLGVSLVLFALRRRGGVGSDSLLGLLAHSSLAFGLVAIALSGRRVDLSGLLFGDVFAVGTDDLMIMGGGAVLILAVLGTIWRDLVAMTVSPEIAAAEGARPQRAELIFLFLLAMTVALAIPIVGVLLITAMLIIPAVAARRLSSSPEAMVGVAMACAMMSVLIGLLLSFRLDTPAGPSIVAGACTLFALVQLLPRKGTTGNRP